MDNNIKGRSLRDIYGIYDLDSLNNSPTRISSQRSSCLDVILTYIPSHFRESGIFEVGLSDHYLVYTVLNKKLPQPKAESIRVRSFKDFDEGYFCSDLSLVPFSTAYVFDDPEDVYWAWEKLFVEVKSFRRRHRDQFQFLNPELREVMRERNRNKRQFNKSRKPEDWEKYRQLRNRVVGMRRKRVRDHFPE